MKHEECSGDLGTLRGRIDEIDLELLRLLEERMELGLRTRRLKERPFDPGREAAVLARARQSSLALLEEGFAGRLFSAILAESRRLQKEDRKLVVFQGEHGAYGESAARQLVPEAACIPCAEFEEVFQSVERGLADFGVVPVENSLEGPVSPVGALLQDTGLSIRGETVVPIRHCLLAAHGADHRELRAAYSHPMALGQCRGSLARLGLEARPYYDTAGAARMLAREKPRGACAVASALAARLYGLKILETGIEDEASNATRFLLLAREPAMGGNKCSVVFTTRHESGQLHAALELIASSGLNLTRIASMPRRTEPGMYSLFLDFEGSDQDPGVRAVLDALAARSPVLKLLGCYPAGSGIDHENMEANGDGIGFSSRSWSPPPGTSSLR